MKTIVLNGAATEILQRLPKLLKAAPKGGISKPTGFVIKGNSDSKSRADLKRPWGAVQGDWVNL